ncbi:hypothetical protein M427DRAFT_486318 [Gonapodya prolifera JEL478]|uniref:Uncharacterized protein n=1 Tax=Gonapodya prolifera (strain JEL478) TaxID=1344416 RepID=A0A139B098_GONPJ|nr:hypothetical protein M427DRAFT_486318 [Gonapodya prolifera JEL478]|eukprot:KXS22399.1 hypothetical protein M427DRAFT_486318 [Gonapodya prolifera JEL478]
MESLTVITDPLIVITAAYAILPYFRLLFLFDFHKYLQSKVSLQFASAPYGYEAPGYGESLSRRDFLSRKPDERTCQSQRQSSFGWLGLRNLGPRWHSYSRYGGDCQTFGGSHETVIAPQDLLAPSRLVSRSGSSSSGSHLLGCLSKAELVALVSDNERLKYENIQFKSQASALSSHLAHKNKLHSAACRSSNAGQSQGPGQKGQEDEVELRRKLKFFKECYEEEVATLTGELAMLERNLASQKIAGAPKLSNAIEKAQGRTLNLNPPVLLTSKP